MGNMYVLVKRDCDGYRYWDGRRLCTFPSDAVLFREDEKNLFESDRELFLSERGIDPANAHIMVPRDRVDNECPQWPKGSKNRKS